MLLSVVLLASGCAHRRAAGSSTAATSPAAPPAWVAALAAPQCAQPQQPVAVGPTPPAAPQPIWAVQMPWAPSSASLHLDYNSTNASAPVHGAYDATSAIFPTSGWQTHTWKLVDVKWAGTQNFGADLRIGAAPGIAVHAVTLSLKPSGAGGAVAGITLPDQAHGLSQVGAGGAQGDSFYHVAQVDGQSAEVLDTNQAAGAGAPSYVYLRLDRSSPVYTTHPTVVYATVTYIAVHPAQPWSEATFKQLAAKGIDRAEINLEWSAIEPEPGHFDFSLLDGDLANAAKAGVKVIPIFWYSVWSGNPASWITDRDIGSTGAAAQVPPWWSTTDRNAYFTYVEDTIGHIKGSPGFGGAFLDYGWLDYMWGPAPGGSGVNGYAAADVARFRQWLPTQYASLAAFNKAEHTAYTSWQQVPAAHPGQPLFTVYQQFRAWSVRQTYGRLAALYRQETDAPLYFYWGGAFGGFGVAFNVPDILFSVARQYHGTVVLDDADHTGLPLVFTSLARTYGVPLLEEWTPRSSGLQAESAEFLGHYGLEFPQAAGIDFFLYNGGKEYTIGFPMYTGAIPQLQQVRGVYPQPPVAVYVSYARIYADPTALQGITNQIGTMWRGDPTAFSVVTSAEVAAGLVKLSAFRAVLPLNGGSDPALTAYAAHGGTIVHNLTQFAPYTTPYAVFYPSTSLAEVVPTVDVQGRTAYLTVTGINPTVPYKGELTLSVAGLGLPSGTYHLVDQSTGKAIPAEANPRCVTLPVDIAPGSLRIWRLEPGPGPSLTPTVASTVG